MKTITSLTLKKNEMNALWDLREKITAKYPYAQMILYGSKARGNDNPYSDIDILVLLDREIDASIRIAINDIKYGIELDYDVIINCAIENCVFWESDLAKAMPYHWSIDKEGIML